MPRDKIKHFIRCLACDAEATRGVFRFAKVRSAASYKVVQVNACNEACLDQWAQRMGEMFIEWTE